MAGLKLVVFDVDGTLIDSLAHIKQAMRAAFTAADLPVPDDAAIRSVIGLSLDIVMDRLHPGLAPERLGVLIDAYKGSFVSRADGAAQIPSPLFPGALDALERLSFQDETLLGIATGKSRRGLDRMMGAHGLGRYFVSTQSADEHPSKPHPSMLQQTLRDSGADARNAVMIGDTSFDLEMGRNAGFATIGVAWGYHDTDILKPYADHIIDRFSALDRALDRIWAAR